MPNIKSLIESNFPFASYWPHQYDIITDITTKLKESNNYILEAPTATGKSVIAYAAAKSILDNEYPNELIEDSPKILICTLTKQLQKQYIDSFKTQRDTSYIYSGRNYKCALYPELQDTADACYYGHPLCLGFKKCPDIANCKYQIQKKKFLKHRIGITNYHYFLKSKLKTNILILDECHELEKLLADEVTITLSSLSLIRFSNTILKIKVKGIKNTNTTKFLTTLKKLVISKDTSISDIEEYVKLFIDNFEPLIGDISDYIDQLEVTDETTIKYAKSLTMLQDIISKYNSFLNSNTDWVISEKFKDGTNHKIVVKPLNVQEFFQDSIAHRADKIIFMSATVCGVKSYTENLNILNYDYLEVPATIPVNHRQVYFISNIGNLNYRNRTELLPRFVECIDTIITYHRKCDENVNGIIHSVSYANAEFIKEHSSFKQDIIIPTADQKNNIDLTLGLGKKILVSPSMGTGIDLYNDRSRFQILLKVPYLNLGDNWVKQKLNQDNIWYVRNAIISIIQCSGRSVRSVDDFANTYILDSNFNRLLNNHLDLFPKYYLNAIKISSV